MKKVILAIALAICAALSFSGCTSSEVASAAGSKSSGATTVIASSKASAPAPVAKPMTAEEITNGLKKAGLHVDGAIVYTDATDTNKLLGRPNQYISKVNFADTQIDQAQTDPDDPIGGTVETFNNASDLQARKEYVESIEKKIPATMEYIYVNGNYLLRVSKQLTPAQAKEYETAFMALK